MEEDVDHLGDLAGELGLLGVPCFMFHEGNDPVARRAFQQIQPVPLQPPEPRLDEPVDRPGEGDEVRRPGKGDQAARSTDLVEWFRVDNALDFVTTGGQAFFAVNADEGEVIFAPNLPDWKNIPLAQIEDAGQQEMLNWVCLAGAMDTLDKKPSHTEFVESYVFNSCKCFTLFPPR